MKPIKFYLRLSQLDKARFFKAKNGDTCCAFVAWKNDKPSDFGDTHTIRQQKAKDEDVKLPIVGNLTIPDDEPPRRQAPPVSRPNPPADPDLDVAEDSVPF